MDTLDVLKDLSTREMQAYGALCLHRFCAAKRIKHPYIDELIQHLLSILVLDKLDGWERHGAALKLSGRGEPVPPELTAQLAENAREDFARLVDFVVEIGITDMYAKSSREPLDNLYRCLAILDENQIERPAVNELFKDRTPRGETEPAWGEVYSHERYEQVKSFFR